MNLLFFVESIVSGLLAGLFSWMFYREGNPWDLIGNFQTGLMTASIFCGFFASLINTFPIIIMERKLRKASTYFLSAFVIAFSLTALSSVVYSISIESFINFGSNIPNSVFRFFWWLLLSISLSCTFGFLHGNFKNLCKALMGITPSFIIAGALIDKMLLNNPNYLLSFLLIGGMLGLGFYIAWELLKEAWLDEYVGHGITFRYYLDDNEFSAGSADENDLALQEGPETLFYINEKDGVHIFELQDTEFRACVNNSKFRYRALIEGDKINVITREFVYHTNISHVKDEMPELS